MLNEITWKVKDLLSDDDTQFCILQNKQSETAALNLIIHVIFYLYSIHPASSLCLDVMVKWMEGK